MSFPCVPLCAAATLLAACMPPAAKAQLEAQAQLLEQLRTRDERRMVETQKLAAQIENVERTFWSEKFCRSEKPEKGEKNFRFAAKLAEFMGQVQAQIPEACTDSNLESALIFMNTQAYANAYYAPGAKPDSMHIARREQLFDLFSPKQLHPSTRFLVLVQPHDEAIGARQDALKFAEKYIAHLRDLVTPRGDLSLRILGPHLLPCRMSTSIRRLYRSAMDNTLPDEVPEGKPRLRIWVFRSDC